MDYDYKSKHDRAPDAKNRFLRITNHIARRVVTVSVIIALCSVLLIFFKLAELKNNGLSFFNNEEEIEINNGQYTAGMEYWNQLDYINAEKNLRGAYEEISKANGLDNNETAAISQKLGALYLEMGCYQQCIEYLNNAYVTFKNNLGDDDGNTIRAKCQIAIYDIKSGNAERGLATLSDAYNQADYIVHKISICQQLAQSNYEIGNYRKALECYDILGDIFADYNIKGNQLMILLNDYGLFEILVGNYEEAVTALEAAIDYAEGESNELANVYSNLSTAYAYASDYAKSDETAIKYQELIEKLFPEENIRYCQLYLDLADRALLKNDDVSALNYYNKSLKVAQDSVGENHAYTAAVYSALGTFYYQSSNAELALINHKKALEIRKNILGKNSIETVLIYENLSKDYYLQKDYLSAKEMAEKSIAICKTVVGDKNINAASSYANLALAQNQLDDVKNGKLNIEKALSICESWFSSDNGTYASILQSAGRFYHEAKDYDTAIEYMQKSLAMYQNIFFESAFPIINTRLFLGDIYFDDGNIENCEEQYKDAWIAVTQTYSEDYALENYFEHRLHDLYENTETDATYDEWFQDWKAQS